MSSATANTPNLAGYVAVSMEPLLKIEDAARLVGRTHWTLRNDVKVGKLRCVRIGRRIMIEPSEIRRLIEEGRR
jgi:Helix-turn-helix domain